jgi:hypothetical protein
MEQQTIHTGTMKMERQTNVSLCSPVEKPVSTDGGMWEQHDIYGLVKGIGYNLGNITDASQKNFCWGSWIK